jgi:hypothetical protein
MVFNATFNNISVISWSVLSVDDTRIPGEKEKTTGLLHVSLIVYDQNFYDFGKSQVKLKSTV